MSNEFVYAYPTAKTLYAVITNGDGDVWDITSSSFVTLGTSDWEEYAVMLAEQAGTGVYMGDFPGGITSPGNYSVVVYLRVGATPVSTDTAIAIGSLAWNGVSENTMGDLNYLRLLSYVDGNYTYDPTSGVLTLSNFNGNEVMTATMTFDSSGNIISRAISA